MIILVNFILINIIPLISFFVFLYPLVMSIIWTIGGIFFWRNHEGKVVNGLLSAEEYPPVTILVPCHNEEYTIALTCDNLKSLNYLDYHVIFIDDASTDNTSQVLRNYVNVIPFFHLLKLEKNHGKAGALNIALSIVQTPYVLILDADTIISRDSIKLLVEPFLSNKKLAAVTGNPLPLNKTNFLSKFQTAEFMSIIGLIKRCQCYLGKIFTVSGCATMYNTYILRNIEGFSSHTATEDIDVTWRLQRQFYDILFQPSAIAYIQVPTEFNEYLKQRKRWATGGWHLLRTHKDIFKDKRFVKLWIMYFDFVIAYIWAFCFVITVIINIFSSFCHGFKTLLVFSWTAGLLCIVCIIQITLAVFINTPYDKSLKNSFYWIPWYPLIFFSVGALLVVYTSLKGVFGSLRNSGKWRSPKREIHFYKQ